MKRLTKLSATIFLFGLFIIGAVILRFYAVTDVNKRRVGAWYATKMCRLAIKVFGLEVTSINEAYLSTTGKLILSNHMSYLDIITYASIKPSIFISSVEIEKTPFLGFIAKLGGTYFVERRNPKLIKLEIGKMSELIEQGFNVVLFPEGTSTNGSKVLPFRSSLLASASVSTGVEVIPACIKYLTIDNEPFSSINCDYVCWYDDMSFAPHLWNFLSTDKVESKTTFFKPINSASSDRKTISNKAYELISAEYFHVA
ncbi:MAG: hypothetical protein C0603_07810 [Denitrovibrio sp.]|nr:MAG: hypothetical protein C0603_07810 [Denitrovibrio sp.]